ncbi:MAG: hypothetical protein ABIR79_17625 [Candidatus Binatia bacterium]
MHLDRALPASVDVGRGHVLYLTGRCYHPTRALHALRVVSDGMEHPVWNHSTTRPDVPSSDPALGDTTPNSLTSGFWAAVPLARVRHTRHVALVVRALLEDGTKCEVSLGAIELRPGSWRPTPLASAVRHVVVCLTTANPEPTWFADQIAAIAEHQQPRWTCLIGDDASSPERLREMRAVVPDDDRFRLLAHWDRIGLYENLARTLAAIPDDADFVVVPAPGMAWNPATIVRVLAAFHPATTLVSEHLVAADDDLGRLLFASAPPIAGTIVFRATLLRDLLPFPPRIAGPTAAQWIACAALATGTLGSTDVGQQAVRHPPLAGYESSRAVGSGGFRRWAMAKLWQRRPGYDEDLVARIVMAKVLRLRLGTEATVAKRAALDRVAALERTPFGVLYDVAAAVRGGRLWSGAEWRCLGGTIAAKVLDAHYRWNRTRLFAERIVHAEVTGASAAASATAGLSVVEQKTAPLRLAVSAVEPRRVNLLTPALDFQHLFAGYLGKLNLALRLTDAGHTVRLVIVDTCDYDPVAWRRAIADYPGLERFFERVEIVDAADRQVGLPVHPRDAFIATTWWTAHLAHRAVRELGGDRFVYLIQEYEPMTFAMGSLYALAAESYTLPHVALFSSELLRDYFRHQRIGVYADGADGGDPAAFAFQNAIASFTVTPETLVRSGPRRLLFYARPEQHAARNMFELGVLALRRVVEQGMLERDGWTIDGIGAGRAFEPVPLGRGCRLALLPRMTLAEYQSVLPGYDVGLSLMLTPHPSLVPLEMAAAGMLTVTNTFANKTTDALHALSKNLIGAPPTVEGIAAALTNAVRRVDDLAARADGARVAWSRDWRTSFDDATLERLAVVLGTPS